MSGTSESVAGMTPGQKRELLAAMLRRRREARAFPLSSTQHRLWLLNQIEPDSPLYNVTHALRLKGGLDVASLERSIRDIWRRHEILRATFDVVDGDPVQRFGSAATFVTQKEDVSHLAEGEREAALPQLIKGEAQRPFDLQRGPLLRAKLWRLSDEDHLLLVTMHHIVSDGWSLGVLTRELSSLYTAFAAGQPSPLPDLPIQYGDFAVWQHEHLRGPLMAEQLSYWRRQLAGAPAELELPTDHPRPAVPTHRGARHHFLLPADLTEGLRRLSHEQGATLFMTLLAGWQALLSRYSNQQDICVGTPVAGRSRVETEPLIGCFVNTLVLRADLSGGLSFRELVGQVRETCLGAYAYHEVPFEKLVEELRPERSLSRTPLFQVMFILQNTPREGWSLGELDAQVVQSGAGTVKFDLTLVAADAPGGELAGCIEYSTDLFEAGTVKRLARNFETLLRGAVAEPEAALARLPLMSERERELVLRVWNETAAEYPADACIHELFERQVEQTPTAVALVYGDEKLSYRELNRHANRLARRLLKHGVRPGSLVGVMMERSVEMVVALLGVLKAGGAYVPLDASYPQERLSFMLADAAPLVLLTQSHLASGGEGYGGHVIALDLEAVAGQESDDVNPESAACPDDIAYTIYTSGSTGMPKGVQVPHRGVISLLCTVAETFGVRRDDILLSVTSLSFDIAVLELFTPLLRGACVVVVARDEAADSARLAERISGSGATIMQATPATWRLLVEGGWEPSPVRLRAICGGEALDTKLAARLRERCAELWNYYGPTETTIWSTAHRVEGADGSIPIGRPLANTQVYVLDEGMGAVPLGVAGELYIGGVGVARGYLNRPGLTAEKFVPNPFAGSGGERLYRTGDLVRYQPGGELEYLGRLDQQVKIRGFRIELGEIEAALKDISGVGECVTVVREAEEGERQIVAYLVLRDGSVVSARELRTRLGARLPGYMIPASFVFLDKLPLTPNLKVDKRALAMLDSKGDEAGDGYVAPRTAMEETLAGLWRQVLKLEQVSLNDNFFELGGHSLLATRLVSRIRDAFNLDFPLRRVFERPTVCAMAAAIEAELRAGAQTEAPPVVRASRDGRLPLSFAQQRLWFLDQLEPGSAFYNLPVALRLSGRLDTGAFTRALNEVVARHEVLRTTFDTLGGEPVQLISPHTPFEPELFNLEAMTEQERQREVGRLAANEAQRPFDLSRGPLLRVTLLKLAEAEHVLLLTVHHIVSDGWSLGVLVKEVAVLYDAFSKSQPSPLEELAVQYADYAAWQRGWLQGEVLEAQLAYWKKQLGGELPVLELPTDRPRPAVQTHRGARHTLTLDMEVTQSLKELSRREGCTLFMVLLAGFQTLLSRYSGQEEVVVGTPIAGRTRSEVEDLVGLFVNTLALRTDLSGDPTFRDLLKRVREVTLGAYAHQEVPFEKLVEELQPERDLSRSPVVQVMLALQNIPQETFELSELRMSGIKSSASSAKMDLIVWAMEDSQGLHASFEYNTDLFDQSTISRLASRFGRLLAAAAAEPSSRLSRLPLLDEEELCGLAGGGCATREPALSGPPLLVEEFERQAAAHPDALALSFDEERVSYRELNERANQLARHLLRLGVGPEVLVGLLLERSTEMVVSLLAVLKAGGSYLPLDPQYPAERLAFTLEDSGARVLITDSAVIERLPALGEAAAAGCRLLLLDAEREAIARCGADNPPGNVLPDNLAYVIYTSGSTGRPKGVQISHSALVNFLRSMSRRPSLDAGETILAATSLSFDIAALEIYLPLMSGASLLLVTREEAADGQALRRRLDAARPDAMQATPTAYRLLLEAGWRNEPQSRLLCGGEAMGEELARRLLDCGGQLWNLYGPTETTVWSSLRQVCEAGEARLLGAPVANTRLYVLDRWGGVAPEGVAGELLIGGDGVARGYLNRPSLTAERFVPDAYSGESGARLYRTGDLARRLANGEIEFLGRIDHQVKVRGFRIELGEIESVLEQHARVRAAVAAVRGAGGEQTLTAYVVCEEGTELSATELREHLRGRLPEYMVPSAFVALAALPLTPNGKLNRSALPEPERPSGGGYLAPRTRTEEVLAGLWAEVLGVERVGVEDDFFALGGHSLLGMRMMAGVCETLQVDLPLRRLFESPTVAGLAVHVENEIRAGQGLPSHPIRRVPPGKPSPLSMEQESCLLREWTDSLNLKQTKLSHTYTACRLTGPLDLAALNRAVNEIIRRHDVLRSVFPPPKGLLTQKSLYPVYRKFLSMKKLHRAVYRAGNLIYAKSERMKFLGRPKQVILPNLTLTVPVVDLRGLAQPEREPEGLRLMNQGVQTPFDYGNGPMLRVTLFRLDEEEHLLSIVMHHIISDAWSLQVFMRELGQYYQAIVNGTFVTPPELPIQYGDFARWERGWLQGEVLQKMVSYWRPRIAKVGLFPELKLPFARSAPADAAYRRKGTVQSITLAPDLHDSLNRLSRQRGVTMYMLILAALNALLHRYTGREHIGVFAPIANRCRPETHDLIGWFAHEHVLTTDLSDDPRFSTLLEQVKEVVLGAYAHQEIPFSLLFGALIQHHKSSEMPSSISEVPYVFFDLRTQRWKATQSSGLRMSPVENLNNAAGAGVEIVAVERADGLKLNVKYSTDRFDEADIRRMLSEFKTLLEGIVADPEARLTKLPLAAKA